MSSTNGATSGAGTTDPFSGLSVAQSLVFCVVLSTIVCVFVLLLLAIAHALSVILQFTASDYQFDIFKLCFIPL